MANHAGIGIARVAIGAAVIAIRASMVPQRVAFAQAAAVFEVSPSKTAGRGIGVVSRTPQRIGFETAGGGEVIAFAYGFPPDRVERRPQWMYDDRCDVAVTTAAPTSLPDQKILLQKLLEERFGLVVHRYSYPSMVYYLVRGAKVNLTEATDSDSDDIPEFRTGLRQVGAFRPITFKHMSMSDLASWLYSPLQLPVLDKTGITGFFDIEIPRMSLRSSAESTIPAVRNALGLDLELHHGTAETLIIDHVEKPRAN